MPDKTKYIVGTSGYSFGDWFGMFYPASTTRKDMFEFYADRFDAVELNYTFYRMPSARTLAALTAKSPEGFGFYVKANQQITHERDRSVIGEFVDNLDPLREAGKLAGVLLQFPQSFHRTVANRRFLAEALGDFAPVPTAVEFRHFSWLHAATNVSLRERNVTLVVPDVPPIRSLYHCPTTATSRTGYLRLHSRREDLWYAGAAQRYNYSYSTTELGEILANWSELEQQVDKVYAFFNNCHRGQAALNAEAFRRILGQID